MLVEWTMTLLHGVLCILMVVGVVFSRSRIAEGAVLGTLILLFFGIRMFRGCAMDTWEASANKPILADMGMAITLKDYAIADKYIYEQIVVGNLLMVHLIKIFVKSIFPLDSLF